MPHNTNKENKPSSQRRTKEGKKSLSPQEKMKLHRMLKRDMMNAKREKQISEKYPDPLAVKRRDM